MGAKVGGGGGGKYDLGQNSDINVTPFVDILLVLLIIFMVAIPMATTAIKVDLPPAVPSPPSDAKPVFISLGVGGKVFLSSTDSAAPTSLPALRNDLLARGITPDKSVMIRADGDVLYEDFMGTLNQLQRDGYFKVGLISEDTNYMN